MRRPVPVLALCLALLPVLAAAQEPELPPIFKVRNFLPHMTRPEVEDLLIRTDMVIFPVGALEQHGTHLPIGTDYLNGVERAKRIAQRADVLVGAHPAARAVTLPHGIRGHRDLVVDADSGGLC